VVVDLAVTQLREQPLDLFVTDSFAEANTVDIGYGHEHRRVVRHDAEVKEAACRTENCFFLDPFDDT
jgi:hypothetical protein